MFSEVFLFLYLVFGNCFDGYFCSVLLLSVFFCLASLFVVQVVFQMLTLVSNRLHCPLIIQNAMKNQFFMLSSTK